MTRFVRCVAILPVVALAGFLSGCTGSTTGATSVTATSATLNAKASVRPHDYGEWWFEYSGNNGVSWTATTHGPYGTPNGQCTSGSGSESAQYPLSKRVSGLTPSTHYIYRLAGTLCGYGPFTVDSTGTVGGTNYSSFTTGALPAGCSLSGKTVTCTYASGSNPLQVPQGVSSIHVVAVGGAGGYGVSGRGARVEADIALASPTTLYAVVGGNGMGREPGANGGGRGGIPDACPFIQGCPPLGTGGGGGGASDLRTSQDDPSSRLLVAAGGGGEGGATPASANNGSAAGGAGGNGGGGNGGNGSSVECSLPDPAFISVPGTGGAGGAAPDAVGSDGGTGHVSDVGPNKCMVIGGGGGGGGGGLHGGAGGGGGFGASGGGGGGGSNRIPPGGSASVDATGTPVVQISFMLP
jgi:hypothetical protein